MLVDLVASPDTDIDSALLIQTAQAADYLDGRIILRGVSPSSLYIRNHSQRVVGHIATSDLVEYWSRGANGFTSEPPMAVLTFVQQESASADDVVVRIDSPALDGEFLSYRASIVEGNLLQRNGSCTLFIDATGRKLFPVSFSASLRLSCVRNR